MRRHTAIQIVLSGLAWLAAGRSDAQSNDLRMPASLVPDTYIVTFRSDPSLQRGHSSLHAGFDRNLTAWSVKWTTVREYHDPILNGAVVKIQNAIDASRLSEATGVESVSPVYCHFPSNINGNGSVRISKRLVPGGSPWAHAVTGVSELHNADRFGQGITIGIVDSGIDYLHAALGAGMGPNKKVLGGHDFVGDDFTGLDDSPLQPSDDPLDTCFGHGTMVAGIIGADPGHRRGLVGVAYKAKINAYRIAGCSGVQRDDVTIDGLLRAHRDGNDIITFATEKHSGWGLGPLALTMENIAAEGRVIVTAAGNRGREGSWHSTDLGYHQGIIHVGYAEMAGFITVPGAVMVAEDSAFGPTSDLYFTPMVTAPGADIVSTMPRSLGSYRIVSSSSAATSYMAGAVALWLQVKGTGSQNAWDVRRAFQNTAFPMQQSPPMNSLIDTVSHQGAGLIQVHKAVFAGATMRPVELLLNDTINADLLWRVFIKNMGEEAVTYTIKHEPAGTAPTKHGINNIRGSPTLLANTANIQVSAEQVTVPPGRTRTIQIQIQPPSGLNPQTFPIYSGYIKAEGSDGSMLQSVYLGLAASMKDMKILDDVNVISGVRFPVVVDQGGAVILQPRTFTMRDNDVPRLFYRLVSGTSLLRLDLVDAEADVTTVMRRNVRSLEESNKGTAWDSAPTKRATRDCPPGTVRRSRSRGALRRSLRWSGDSNQIDIRRMALAKRTVWDCILSASGRNLGSSSRSNSGSGRGIGWFGRFGSGRSRGRSRGSSFSRSGSTTERARFSEIPIVGMIEQRTHLPRHVRTGPGATSEGFGSFRVARFQDGRQIPDGSYKLLLRALKNFGDVRYQRDYEVWTSVQINIRRP